MINTKTIRKRIKNPYIYQKIKTQQHIFYSPYYDSD